MFERYVVVFGKEPSAAVMCRGIHTRQVQCWTGYVHVSWMCVFAPGCLYRHCMCPAMKKQVGSGTQCKAVYVISVDERQG